MTNERTLSISLPREMEDAEWEKTRDIDNPLR